MFSINENFTKCHKFCDEGCGLAWSFISRLFSKWKFYVHVATDDASYRPARRNSRISCKNMNECMFNMKVASKMCSWEPFSPLALFRREYSCQAFSFPWNLHVESVWKCSVCVIGSKEKLNETNFYLEISSWDSNFKQQLSQQFSTISQPGEFRRKSWMSFPSQSFSLSLWEDERTCLTEDWGREEIGKTNFSATSPAIWKFPMD